MSFDSFGLQQPILEAVKAKGFENPTPIQSQTIPLLLSESTDLIALAGTGTGKTAAFGLPLLQKLDPSLKQVQAVILCPTRELCIQITNELQSFATNMPKTWILAVYGGSSIRDQIFSLRKGVQIIVATPGRLMDLMERNEADISAIQTVVLDEADEMLDMGFKEDIDKILEDTPSTKNVWLFSATFPRDVERIARTYMNDPFEITIGSKNEAQKSIDHKGYLIHEKDRYNALKRLLDFYPDIYGMIFCRTRMETQQIAEKLIKDGYPSASLHGDLSQAQRDQVMRSFREKTVTILVATDVAARGIDVDSVTHVIHYNLPDDIESYTHRSGRTGRAGKTGISMALINTREKGRIHLIERQSGIKIQLDSIPASEAICEKQLFAMIDKMANVTVNEQEIEPFMNDVYTHLADMSKEELIKRFVSIEFNRFIEYYRHAKPIEVIVERTRKSNDRERNRGRDRERDFGRDREFSRGRGSDRPRRESTRFSEGSENRRSSSDSPRRERSVGPEAGMSTFVVEGVSRDIRKGALVRILCEAANISSEQIGQIAFVKGMALVDVKQEVSENVGKINTIKLDGKLLNMRTFVREARPTTERYSGESNFTDKERRRSGGKPSGRDHERKRSRN